MAVPSRIPAGWCLRGRATRAACAACGVAVAVTLGAPPAPAQDAARQVSVTPASDALDLKVGGMLQIQAEAGQHGDARYSSGADRFLLRRARLFTTGHVRGDLEFKLEMDLSGSLGEASGLRAQMTDGYAQWSYNAQLAVRAGQFKTPFGYEQLAPDARIFTIERTLGNDRLTLGRQLGVQASGELAKGRLAYAAGAFNGTPANQSANDAEQFLMAGRLSAVPWQGEVGGQKGRWVVGGGGYAERNSHVSGAPAEFGFDATPGGSADNAFVGDRRGFAVDTQARWGRAELWAEFLNARYEPDNPVPATEIEANAWYVQASCFVVQQRLQGLIKYDWFDPNTDVEDDHTRTVTVGLNQYVKGDDFKLMVDYLLVTGPHITGSDDKLLARWQVLF